MTQTQSKFSMKGFIEDVCEEIGPRLGTSDKEKEAGRKIKGILENYTNDVVLEEFSCHPKAFLDFIKIAFVAGVAATALFFWFPLISMILQLYAVSTFIFEQMLLKEYVDFFFPKKTGENVIGKIPAKNEAKQIVIVSGHHDSAYEFPLFEKFKEKFDILAYGTAGFMVLSAIGSLIKFLLDVFQISTLLTDLIFFSILLIALILGGYIAFNLHSKNIILGANDNLSGVAIILALAEHFSQNELNNIELWCISFSCEECMRGSKRFVEKHKNELKDSITLNYDMVGRGNCSIIAKEPAFTATHSQEVVQAFHDSSINANAELPIIELGFGGTDAAFFSKAGLKAISLAGVTKDLYPDTWHELSDTPEFIEEDKLQKTLKTSIQYLTDLDKKL